MKKSSICEIKPRERLQKPCKKRQEKKQKIEEMKMKEKTRHIYCTMKTRTMGKRDVVSSPCTKSQGEQLKLQMTNGLKLWKSIVKSY